MARAPSATEQCRLLHNARAQARYRTAAQYSRPATPSLACNRLTDGACKHVPSVCKLFAGAMRLAGSACMPAIRGCALVCSGSGCIHRLGRSSVSRYLRCFSISVDSARRWRGHTHFEVCWPCADGALLVPVPTLPASNPGYRYHFPPCLLQRTFEDGFQWSRVGWSG